MPVGGCGTGTEGAAGTLLGGVGSAVVGGFGTGVDGGVGSAVVGGFGTGVDGGRGAVDGGVGSAVVGGFGTGVDGGLGADVVALLTLSPGSGDSAAAGVRSTVDAAPLTSPDAFAADGDDVASDSDVNGSSWSAGWPTAGAAALDDDGGGSFARVRRPITASGMRVNEILSMDSHGVLSTASASSSARHTMRRRLSTCKHHTTRHARPAPTPPHSREVVLTANYQRPRLYTVRGAVWPALPHRPPMTGTVTHSENGNVTQPLHGKRDSTKRLGKALVMHRLCIGCPRRDDVPRGHCRSSTAGLPAQTDPAQTRAKHCTDRG